MLRGAGVRVAEMMDIESDADRHRGRHVPSRGRLRHRRPSAGARLSPVWLCRPRLAARSPRPPTLRRAGRGAARSRREPGRSSNCTTAPRRRRRGARRWRRCLPATPGIDVAVFSNDDMAVGGVFHCLAESIAIKSAWRFSASTASARRSAAAAALDDPLASLRDRQDGRTDGPRRQRRARRADNRRHRLTRSSLALPPDERSGRGTFDAAGRNRRRPDGRDRPFVDAVARRDEDDPGDRRSRPGDRFRRRRRRRRCAEVAHHTSGRSASRCRSTPRGACSPPAPSRSCSSIARLSTRPTRATSAPSPKR